VGGVRYVCCFTPSQEYKAAHVNALARQVPNLLCLTNHPAGVQCETQPLTEDLPHWWVKLNLFAPQAPDNAFFLDLDTYVMGSTEDIANHQGNLWLRDFYHLHRPASGLLRIVDKGNVWEHFMADPEGHMQRHRLHGDQGYLATVWQAGFFQDHYPMRIKSYKADKVGADKPSCDILCFHGKPKPWDVAAEWLPRYD